MMQESSASAVKDLVTNYASDPAAVARFIDRAKSAGYSVDEKAVRLWLNRSGAVQEAARWSSNA